MDTEKLRGVNLGGWLVLERWITPSLFEGTAAPDEFSFMQTPGAAEKIERHRHTFITEDDFRWLAEHGVNAMRIPVGYWLFDGDEPFIPCVLYLDWAVKMAEKYGLKVLIDLHAAQGSQNGNDHSGRIGRAEWYKKSQYQKKTIAVLTRIAKRYKNNPALWGIELLNEPELGLCKFFQLRRFYTEAYAELSRVARPGTYIVFSDGFAPRLFSGAIKRTGGLSVVMDVHWYQTGRANLHHYFKQLLKWPDKIRQFERHQPVVIGEWSGMLSHETLEGYSEAEQSVFQRQHIKQQLAAYESAAGWFYWTYKTETGGIWDFREQVETGNLLFA